jgi:hypothetical protein
MTQGKRDHSLSACVALTTIPSERLAASGRKRTCLVAAAGNALRMAHAHVRCSQPMHAATTSSWTPGPA